MVLYEIFRDELLKEKLLLELVLLELTEEELVLRTQRTNPLKSILGP